MNGSAVARVLGVVTAIVTLVGCADATEPDGGVK